MPGLVRKSDQESNVTPLGTTAHKYSQFLDRMTEIGENDIIMRANCKFCNHPARAEAEEKWERTSGSFASVERFFEECRKQNPEYPSVSYSNIKAHIEHHYQKQIRNLRMREYGESLKETMSQRAADQEMLEALSTSLQMKYVDVASDAELDSAKQTDSMVKLAKILVDVVKFKAELTGDFKQINIFAEKVMNVWNHAIQSEPDDNVKRKFLQFLDDLETEVGVTGT